VIEIVKGNPPEEELTAIVVALQQRHAGRDEAPERPSAWSFAARNPDLEIEDLRRVR